MYCTLRDEQCIDEACPQYNINSMRCELDRKISGVLYGDFCFDDLLKFFKYLKEIKPRHARREDDFEN